MTDETREHYRRKAITCLELTKGFTIEQRNAMSNGHNNCINTIDELSYVIMELTAEPIAEKAEYNQGLEDLCKKVAAGIAGLNQASHGRIYGTEVITLIRKELEAMKTEIKK